MPSAGASAWLDEWVICTRRAALLQLAWKNALAFGGAAFSRPRQILLVNVSPMLTEPGGAAFHRFRVKPISRRS